MSVAACLRTLSADFVCAPMRTHLFAVYAMQSVGPMRLESFPQAAPERGWRALSILTSLLAAILLLVVSGARVERLKTSPVLLLLLVISLCTVVFVHSRFLLHLNRQHRRTAGALFTTEHEFQEMADNIHEIFWMIDAESKKTIYVNQAYETITGRSCRSLQRDPFSYEEAIHPDDRSRVLGKLEEATQTGQFEERFRIVWPTGQVRWVSARGFPVREFDGSICRLVGTAQDITAQKRAEEQIAQNLALAKGAWAESEALRKATLALTQDLRVDFVLDALLQSLTELIAYDCARIWLLEGDTRLFVARERVRHENPREKTNYPLTLDAAGIPFLQRILANQRSVLLSDTKQEPDWRVFKDHTHLRSWLCVPLVASQRTLGLLSVGATRSDSFTSEDLRRAQILAIPAAAAIQNSRLYECASIYGSELEKRIEDLHEAKQALLQSEQDRMIAEDKFQKVFRSSPVAFSITTAGEGRFVDVNAAFERRYGYVRAELIGHTVHELRMWEDPGDRALMIAKLLNGGPIRNIITRLRTKAGEIKLTTYSADRIQFDGQACVLAVSEDLSKPELSN
jgi:PAS domain S-box-containing protein